MAGLFLHVKVISFGTRAIDEMRGQPKIVKELQRHVRKEGILDSFLQKLSDNHGEICFAGIFRICTISIKHALKNSTHKLFTLSGLLTLFEELERFVANIGERWKEEVLQGRLAFLLAEIRRFMGLMLLEKPAYLSIISQHAFKLLWILESQISFYEEVTWFEQPH